MYKLFICCIIDLYIYFIWGVLSGKYSCALVAMHASVTGTAVICMVPVVPSNRVVLRLYHDTHLPRFPRGTKPRNPRMAPGGSSLIFDVQFTPGSDIAPQLPGNGICVSVLPVILPVITAVTGNYR